MPGSLVGDLFHALPEALLPGIPTHLYRASSRLVEAARGDRVGGAGLALAAAVALAWDNLAGRSYASAWMRPVAWPHLLGLDLSVRGWVDQGLLFGFFALVGLEIRREVVVGELGHLRRAAVPVLAAVGGMALPALTYVAIVAGRPGAHGWGVPMATDVAFSLGTLALVGGTSPRARVFLMTLAVADDILSILVLVGFYSRGTRPGWLAGGLAALVALVVLWALRAPFGFLRPGLAAVAWWSMLHAGIEASVIGVVLGAFGPPRAAARPGRDARPATVPETSSPQLPGVRRWERRLEPVVNLLVLPVFALANAGVSAAGSGIGEAAALRVLLAVLAARVVGKPLGIVLATLVARRALGGRGQPRVPPRGLAGLGASASVGFTVPLLLVQAGLPPGPLAAAATVGLLGGSVLGAGATVAVLRVRRRSA